jgi:outer membrane protein X
MRNLFIVAALLVIGASSFAQEADKFRVGLELGCAIPKGGMGILFTLEPKYNLKDNLNVGIRWESAGMAKEVTVDQSNGVSKASISANTSFLGTIDYYFNKGNSAFAPYIGSGLGVYSLGNVSVSSSSNSDIANGLSIGSKFGGMVRTGFEAGKFRMGVEYNIVPASKYDIVEGSLAGSINNSYLGVSIGFFIGGGQWNYKAAAE